jgi:CubicO group peptidase (beta-lactamase class C family)
MMPTNRLPGAIVRARGGVGWALLNVNVVLDPATFNYPSGRDEYGWDGSAGTIFWIDPHLDMVTVLMTQSSPPNPDNLRQRFKTIVQGAIGK